MPSVEEEIDVEPEEEESFATVVSGRVLAPSESLPEGATVFVYIVGLEGDSPAVSQTETDEEGVFELTLPAGDYRLVARASGFLSTAEEISLLDGETVEGLTLKLEPGRSVRGKVLAEGVEVQDALEHVLVVVEGGGYRLTGYTDEYGRFEVSGLPSEVFQVRAYDKDLGADERTVASGGEVTLMLGRREVVRGSVYDASGRPAAEAPVYGLERSFFDTLADADPFGELEGSSMSMGVSECSPSPECYELARTDAHGFFELEAAKGETLTLVSERQGQRSEEVTARAGDRFVMLSLALPAPLQKRHKRIVVVR